MSNTIARFGHFRIEETSDEHRLLALFFVEEDVGCPEMAIARKVIYGESDTSVDLRDSNHESLLEWLESVVGDYNSVNEAHKEV